MAFSYYPTNSGSVGLARVSGGTFTGAAGTALDTSIRNLATTLTNRAYDVKVAYGATGDGTTNDTTAVQNAINDAHSAGGGVVFLPAGTYSCSNLTWYRDVSIIGVGWGVQSVIKARSSGTLLNYPDPGDYQKAYGILAGFGLNGNSVATTGLYVRNLAAFHFEDMAFYNCATNVYLGGTVGGVFSRCVFNPSTTYGVNAESLNSIQSNLVQFRDCHFGSNSGIAVNWGHGSLLHFNACDFETCGTNGDAATGCVYVQNMNPNGEGIGLLMDGGTWFENNYGGFLIKIGPAISSKNRGFQAIIRDSLMYDSGSVTHGIYVDGTGSYDTKVYLDGVTMYAGDVYLNGAKAKLYRNLCDVSITNNGGASYSPTYA